MSKLLFKLSNVPDDEAQDIRELLAQHDISFYETDAGFWRVGLDAIWLVDDSQEQSARQLLDSYQNARLTEQIKLREDLEEQGLAPSFIKQLCARPIRSMGFMIGIVFVLGLTLIPFLMLLHSKNS